MLLRVSTTALALGVALFAASAVMLVRARDSQLHILASVSNAHLVEPDDWERHARAALGSSDSARCPRVTAERTWNIPPQEGLREGGAIVLAMFDGQATCEADRADPCVLVVADHVRARGSIRLPDNAQSPEFQVVGSSGKRLVIVVRTEVWRGNGGVVVAVWDPKCDSIETKVDTSSLPGWDHDYACAVRSRDEAPFCREPASPGKRYEFEGVVFDVLATKR